MLPNAAYAAGRIDALEKFAILDRPGALRDAFIRAQAAGRTGLADKLQNRYLDGSPMARQRRLVGLADQYTQQLQARQSGQASPTGQTRPHSPSLSAIPVRRQGPGNLNPTYVGPAPVERTEMGYPPHLLQSRENLDPTHVIGRTQAGAPPSLLQKYQGPIPQAPVPAVSSRNPTRLL